MITASVVKGLKVQLRNCIVKLRDKKEWSVRFVHEVVYLPMIRLSYYATFIFWKTQNLFESY